MDMISCDKCGVVLDKSKVKFPTDMHLDDGSVDLEKGAWNSDARDYVPFVRCPVCSEPLTA